MSSRAARGALFPVGRRGGEGTAERQQRSQNATMLCRIELGGGRRQAEAEGVAPESGGKRGVALAPRRRIAAPHGLNGLCAAEASSARHASACAQGEGPARLIGHRSESRLAIRVERRAGYTAAGLRSANPARHHRTDARHVGRRSQGSGPGRARRAPVSRRGDAVEAEGSAQINRSAPSRPYACHHCRCSRSKHALCRTALGAVRPGSPRRTVSC